MRDLCDPTLPADEQCGGRPGEACLYFTATANSGTMTFDNAGGALVALMQAVTFDDFDVVMHKLAELFSPAASYAYFVAVVVICGFFIINLFLTVMFDEFMKAKAEDALVESAIAEDNPDTKPKLVEIQEAVNEEMATRMQQAAEALREVLTSPTPVIMEG